jgi:hypothetical protein
MESISASATPPSQCPCTASPPGSGSTSTGRDQPGTTANTVVLLTACRNMNLLPSLSATREIDTQPNLNPVSAPRSSSRPGSKFAMLFSCINSHADYHSESVSSFHCTKRTAYQFRAILNDCADCPSSVSGSFSYSLPSRGTQRKQSESNATPLVYSQEARCQH